MKDNTQDMQDALDRLWDSTAAFHARFETSTEYEARVRVLVEECGELVRATSEEEAKEAADVIVTAYGLAALYFTGHSWLHGESIMHARPQEVLLSQLWEYLYFVQLGIRDDERSYTLSSLLSVAACASVFTTVDAINATIAKNDAKTWDTHYKAANGKITRKTK